jgi:hypothetical protein
MLPRLETILSVMNILASLAGHPSSSVLSPPRFVMLRRLPRLFRHWGVKPAL